MHIAVDAQPTHRAFQLTTILVVDDDPETRVLLNAILGENQGYEILFATDGEGGISIYEKTQPDLVIADLVMPRLHGVLMIEHLMAVHPDARIIAVSGNAPEQLDRAKGVGAVAVLRKPIDRDELTSAVERALSVRGPWGDAR